MACPLLLRGQAIGRIASNITVSADTIRPDKGTKEVNVDLQFSDFDSVDQLDVVIIRNGVMRQSFVLKKNNVLTESCTYKYQVKDSDPDIFTINFRSVVPTLARFLEENIEKLECYEY